MDIAEMTYVATVKAFDKVPMDPEACFRNGDWKHQRAFNEDRPLLPVKWCFYSASTP